MKDPSHVHRAWIQVDQIYVSINCLNFGLLILKKKNFFVESFWKVGDLFFIFYRNPGHTQNEFDLDTDIEHCWTGLISG